MFNMYEVISSAFRCLFNRKQKKKKADTQVSVSSLMERIDQIDYVLCKEGSRSCRVFCFRGHTAEGG